MNSSSVCFCGGGEGAGPLANNIGPERTAAIRSALGLKEGDAAFFVAGDPAKFWKFAGLARTAASDYRKLRAELTANADYVGAKFPDEARKIYFEEAPPRSIFGKATLQEARELCEEGIPVCPLPPLPEDQN